MSNDHLGSLVKISCEKVIKQADLVISEIKKIRAEDEQESAEELIKWFKKKHKFATKNKLCGWLSNLHWGSYWLALEVPDEGIVGYVMEHAKQNDVTSYYDSRTRYETIRAFLKHYPSHVCEPWYKAAVSLKKMAEDASYDGPNERYVYVSADDHKSVFRWRE